MIAVLAFAAAALAVLVGEVIVLWDQPGVLVAVVVATYVAGSIGAVLLIHRARGGRR